MELRVGSTSWMLTPGESVSIGRDAAVRVRIDDGHVSRLHAVLESSSLGWVLVDHSRNGTFVGGRRVGRVAITGPTTVELGRRGGVELAITPTVRPHGPAPQVHLHGRGPSTVHRIIGARIRVGRLPDNDVVVDDLLVSRRHAELQHDGQDWRLTDLGSPNGTFVNGRRITETTVTERDLIGIGHSLLQLAGGSLVEYLDSGDIAFEAEGLTVTTKEGRTLLEGVSFSLPGRCLLAVIGPSGAGKSTLLRALTGFRPADTGRVRYDGRDLYSNFDELRQRIGLVPQDDILHPQLTVRRALSFAARLRFPTEVSDHDREQRIDEVLAELGLTERAQLRISKLSGGQRKRTSVALELLTKPSLLFLDEPTSGLDPGLDKSVMQNLRDLADDGRTVVVVTHSVANLDLCDRLLILAPGGRVAYIGPPGQALNYFGQPDFAEVFLMLERETDTDWAARFQQSPDYYRNVEATLAIHRGSANAASPGRATRQQPPLVQFSILCRRYLAVIAADRPYLISLAVLPVILSLLARAVPGSDGLSVAGGSTRPLQLLLILIIGGALMGSAAAVRELVKERAIYLREHATGLSLGAYLGSKIAVLAMLTGVQAVLFTLLSLLGVPGPDRPVVIASGTTEIMLAVLGVTWAAMVVGLLISAAIDNADRGMPLLVLLVMAQLILCGGLFPVKGRAVLEQLSWLVPARWGYASGAATLDIEHAPGTTDDLLWHHNAATWVADVLFLSGLTLVLIVATCLLLRRLDSARGRSS
ncbi:FHA domain-containing protein [Pseudonocardia sp. GCM10023141]|uniref:FHA domain-containing protein n=1 Tax=Pseudonocardia sp. GCM10023141 TaxID=3252653 RepID=UPI00360AA252